MQQKQSYLNQLASTMDPPLVLHLVVLILFQSVHKNAMIHASGKFVPELIHHLSKPLSTKPGYHDKLLEYQNLVIRSIESQRKEIRDSEGLQSQLESKMQSIKDLALNFGGDEL